MSEMTSEAHEAVRILIVDDIADNREVLARRFERRGYRIVEADGGAKALTLLDAGGIDIVLLDVVMPEINGLEVLARIRATPSMTDLPVIMVSAQAESGDIVRGLELGANDYITKPVDFPVALARVETQVGRRRAEVALVELNQTLERNVVELHDAVVKAEAANRAKSDFLANMSHEIRTPLNGVLGVTEVLGLTQLDERQRELVGIITSSASLLERLLADVLDLARVESGRLELQTQTIQLGDLVRATIALVEPTARSKGLRFHAAIDPEAGGRVDLDPTRLSQILINLLSNAVKFTAEGEVTLEVACIPNGRRFRVRDTGIGFSPEVGARLFGRFEQGDSSITKQFGGTGLGLAISRQLAELMGGTLDGTSEPGQGAVFVLELPTTPPTSSDEVKMVG